MDPGELPTTTGCHRCKMHTDAMQNKLKMKCSAWITTAACA